MGFGPLFRVDFLLGLLLTLRGLYIPSCPLNEEDYLLSVNKGKLDQEKQKERKMGLFSFLGRVFFASLILVSAWQMFNGFGFDGGPAALKLNLAKANLSSSSRLWVTLSNIEVRQASVTVISLIATGGVLFVMGKFFGAYLAFYFTVVSVLFCMISTTTDLRIVISLLSG
ncbi:unnamed protein product [Eruca vesicaria subsp. sativa]|uniref:Transmembrane protein n=1 Tax=Eruca vesicaria subsp. sativa TaxID=29727 RepID=A0ABC8JZ13_ERUVS|nr:unnamed protein product [Eruca vesicaria subsp. sativa]